MAGLAQTRGGGGPRERLAAAAAADHGRDAAKNPEALKEGEMEGKGGGGKEWPKRQIEILGEDWISGEILHKQTMRRMGGMPNIQSHLRAHRCACTLRPSLTGGEKGGGSLASFPCHEVMLSFEWGRGKWEGGGGAGREGGGGAPSEVTRPTHSIPSRSPSLPWHERALRFSPLYTICCAKRRQLSPQKDTPHPKPRPVTPVTLRAALIDERLGGGEGRCAMRSISGKYIK